MGTITDSTEIFPDGRGMSEESAIEIDSAAAFESFRDEVNSSVSTGRYYRLTADIDLSDITDWEPVARPFRGTLDGGGHTVSVNFVRLGEAGIFGEIEGTVKNLCVSGDILSSRSAGGIALSLRGGTIENCKFSGSISSSGGYAGGIAGYIRAGGAASPREGKIDTVVKRGVVRNCKFDGNINVSGNREYYYNRAGRDFRHLSERRY